MDRIAAIVLAAGFSSRMHGFKPLLPLGEQTVLEKVVDNFREGGIYDIRVVVGHNGEKVAQLLQGKNLQLILNKNYSDGMFSSIIAGIKSLENSIDGCFLLPSDIPLVKPSTIRDMAKAFSISRAGIVYPCFQGKRGHPVFVSSQFKNTILKWSEPDGLNKLLYQFENEIMEVHVDDPGILMDMDTPEDYRKLLLLNQEVFNHGKYGIPEHSLQHC